MKAYQYNHRIDFLEVDPNHLYEGIKFARENKYYAIRIRGLVSNKGFILSSLNELDDFKNIEKLIIGDDFDIIKKIDLAPLYNLVKLKRLSFKSKNITPDFSKLAQLETLYFKYHKGIKDLSPLKNLKDLLIFSLNMPDCKILSDLSSLEMLRLTRGTFTSLNGIENLKDIKRFDIAYSSKLHDAKALMSLSGLKRLHIEKCKSLTDFSFLKGNPYIENLFIDTLDSLDFVPTMPNLKSISFWNCIDGNMQPLLESKSLEEIYFFPNKKHYTHKVEEIKEIHKKRI